MKHRDRSAENNAPHFSGYNTNQPNTSRNRELVKVPVSKQIKRKPSELKLRVIDKKKMVKKLAEELSVEQKKRQTLDFKIQELKSTMSEFSRQLGGN